MAWTMTGSMAFGAFAALVQLSIGSLLVLRNPRNERVALVGSLFLLNGVAAAMIFASAGFPELRDGIGGNTPPLASAFRSASLFFGLSTNLLLIVLALLYPRRTRWLNRAPHGIVLFAVLAVLLFATRAWVYPEFFAGRSARIVLTGPVVFYAYGIFDLAFPVLMLRWAWLWREDMPANLRAQFAMVFAAFGVRAVHQMIHVPYKEFMEVVDGRVMTTMGAFWGGLLFVAVVGALIVSLALMVRTTARLQGTDRKWHWFVMAFLGIGALEGVMNIALNDTNGWWSSLTGDFDVLVIRPVLIWFAITRTQFLDVRFRSNRFAWGVAFVLTAAAVMGGVFEVFGGRGPAMVQWSLSALIGLAVASVVVAVSQSAVMVRAEAWARSPTAKEMYATQLDEAYRNGPPSIGEEMRLARVRKQLGIDQEMHDELTVQFKPASQSAISTSVK